MKILVTGGAGFIGSHIVDRYLKLGHSVVVVDNLSTGKQAQVSSQAIFYQVDIRDQTKIEEIFAREKPQVLNHHAAQMDVRKSVADPAFDAEVNLIGLLRLMEAARKNDVQKVLFASSGGAIYGDATELPTSEAYPTQPASPYGVAKLASEYYLHFYFQTYGIPYIALRYGNVYGPRQNPHGEAGVVAIFTQKLISQVQPLIYGDGEQSRDFVYVGDVVNANEFALSFEKAISLNVGTGKATTINQIYDELQKLTGSNMGKKYASAKPGEQRISVLNAAKAKRFLDWQPQTDLTQGLSQTVEYFQHEA